MPTAIPSRLSGIPRALLEGRDADLLAPLRWLAPGELPGADEGAPADRRALAAALAAANAAYGHPRAAALAGKLADPATRVVATGQQTGLFGGALLCLTKAAAAVRYAEALEARDGTPAVAVFWMATEDHDFAEVASAVFPAADGLHELSLGADPQPLAPVGLRTVGPAVERHLEELAALFPADWFAAWIARLRGWWRPEARFGEAFPRQLVATLGARAPLFLDALLPELKVAERPHLARLVEGRAALEAAFVERERTILARGHALQVAAQRQAAPLFLYSGAERRRIEWRGESSYGLRGDGEARAVAELLETIADNPAAVSPGALARPAIQDAVLGTTLQLLGPGELAYAAQAAVVYPALGLAAPRVALRPQALVLEARQAEHLAGLGIELAELLADPDRARRGLGERAGGGFVAPVRERIDALVGELGAPARELDAGLEKPFEKTRETIDRALEAFAAKVAAAAARRDETRVKRLEQLIAHLAPGGAAQERRLSAAYFPGRHGEGFGAALLDQLDLDPRVVAVVDPAGRSDSVRP
jgi:bacillithiol biosynthesis cysteine-adding enzyme BshC